MQSSGSRFTAPPEAVPCLHHSHHCPLLCFSTRRSLPRPGLASQPRTPARSRSRWRRSPVPHTLAATGQRSPASSRQASAPVKDKVVVVESPAKARKLQVIFKCNGTSSTPTMQGAPWIDLGADTDSQHVGMQSMHTCTECDYHCLPGMRNMLLCMHSYSLLTSYAANSQQQSKDCS